MRLWRGSANLSGTPETSIGLEVLGVTAIVDLYDDDLGPDLEPDECQFAVHPDAPFTTATPYWEEKARVCQIVASRANDTYLKEIVADLHGRDEHEPGDTEFRRVRRFVSSHPEFFAVRKESGLVTARPTLELLDLIKRGIIQRPGESPSKGGSGYDGSREFCESLLQSIRWDHGEEELITEKGRDLLEQNLSEYLERINDLRLVLRSEHADPEYLSLPYKTRFNDRGRISKQHAILGNVLEKAGEWYDHAVLVTLTTDPKLFSSTWEMWCGDPDDSRDTGINGNWNRFMSWLAADSRLADRPDYVKVLEATEKGMPHIHAIVFLDEDQTLSNGMPWLESKNAVSNYWGKYQGTTVDLKALTYEDDLGDEYDKDEGWVRWNPNGNHGGTIDGDGDGHQTAGEYLGKYLSAIYGGMRSAAGLEPEPAVATDGGEPVDELEDAGKYEDKAATWKIAMYWATRRKIRTESRDLRQAVEEDHEDEEENEEKAELAEQIRTNRYRFVGAYPYDEIPAHIRNGLVPVDSLMESLREELEHVDHQAASDPPPERDRDELIMRMPAAARPLFDDELEGSGMLFGDDPDDDPDDGPDEQGTTLEYDEQDILEYPHEDALTDDEREEAEELGGFTDASGFM